MKFNFQTTTTTLNKEVGEGMDKVFEGFDKSFQEAGKLMEEMLKSGASTTKTTTSGMKLYANTKEELLKEVNTYTSKGYKLEDMGTEKVGSAELQYATVSLKVSL